LREHEGLPVAPGELRLLEDAVLDLVEVGLDLFVAPGPGNSSYDVDVVVVGEVVVHGVEDAVEAGGGVGVVLVASSPLFEAKFGFCVQSVVEALVGGRAEALQLAPVALLLLFAHLLDHVPALACSHQVYVPLLFLLYLWLHPLLSQAQQGPLLLPVLHRANLLVLPRLQHVPSVQDLTHAPRVLPHYYEVPVRQIVLVALRVPHLPLCWVLLLRGDRVESHLVERVALPHQLHRNVVVQVLLPEMLLRLHL